MPEMFLPDAVITENELNAKGYLTSYTETDPTVPSWAKAASKPTYTASEIGALPADTVIPSIEGLAAETYVESSLSNHNTAIDSHNDIRDLISGLTSRLNALADSDDTTLDQMSEIVAYIKSNKSLIEEVTTNKVNVSDIINNLTTNVSNKPLSAAQGVALKALIDAIDVSSTVDSAISTHNTSTDAHNDIRNLINTKAGKIVAGETFTVDDETITADTGAEIFNDYSFNKATGMYSHAEGYITAATGKFSHAEGRDTIASGHYSHAEGYDTTASGYYCHAEGNGTLASYYYSHAEGRDTIASGDCSHAEGYNTIASGDSQHVQGQYNIEDDGTPLVKNTYAHIIGNGTEDARSNAHTIDWSGNAWFAGNVYVGSTSGTNRDTGSKKLVAAPTDVAAGDLLMYDGTNWVCISKADLIAEIIAALPSAEEASF